MLPLHLVESSGMGCLAWGICHVVFGRQSVYIDIEEDMYKLVDFETSTLNMVHFFKKCMISCRFIAVLTKCPHFFT